jgi:23S rRNA (adenine2503-C2)-methyltransferase
MLMTPYYYNPMYYNMKFAIVKKKVKIMIKVDIKSMLPHELEDYFLSIGEKSYRGKQVFRWLHSGVISFEQMTNLPNTLRNHLVSNFVISIPEIVEKQTSAVDGTSKCLWRLDDKSAIESVLMTYEHGVTVCLSTQVGCKMGCLFCASGANGLLRNMTASEILDQVIFTQQELSKRISNIVLMGVGEPLDNFDNVIRFIMLVTNPSGINIGARHITISTCGIIENIDKLANYGIQLTLAISLHAPDDATRKYLMPVAHKYTVDELFDCGENYFKKTGRRVTYEYAMINEVNDTPRQAKMLSEKLLDSRSHLNIIPLNNAGMYDFIPSSQRRAKIFLEHLDKKGVNYTVRRSKVLDIAAASGLLRQRSTKAVFDHWV